MKIKVGNMVLVFAGNPPMTKKDEKVWGHCTDLGNGEVLLWLNPLTAVDEKWLETLIHELIHVVESAYGKKISHALVKLLAVAITAALTQAGLIDAGEVRKRFEQGTEGLAQLWDGSVVE